MTPMKTTILLLLALLSLGALSPAFAETPADKQSTALAPLTSDQRQQLVDALNLRALAYQFLAAFFPPVAEECNARAEAFQEAAALVREGLPDWQQIRPADRPAALPSSRLQAR